MAILRTTMLAAAVALAAAGASAQTTQGHQGHHAGAPAAAPPAAAMPAQPLGPSHGSQQAVGHDGMMGNRGMMGPGMTGGMGMMGMASPHGAQRLDGRLAYIKAEIKITDAQATQWNLFADAVRANAKAMTGMHARMMAPAGGSTPLPDRLALEEKMVAGHLEALKRVSEALAQLYAVLGAEQKKAADGIVIGPMGLPTGMM
jgi:hypothetical protein